MSEMQKNVIQSLADVGSLLEVALKEALGLSLSAESFLATDGGSARIM